MSSSNISTEKYEIESSTQDDLSKDRLKEILQTLSNLKCSQMDDIFPKLTDLLLKVNAELDINLMLSRNTMKDFFCSKFIPKCTESILSYKNISNVNITKTINQCLRQIIALCARAVHSDLPGLLETTGLILNPACEYYCSLEKSLFINNVEGKDSSPFGLASLNSGFGEAGGFDRIYQIILNTQNDRQTKSIIFKIFIDCPPELKDKYLEKIIIRVIDMPLDKITEMDIDFIINFYNSSWKSVWLAKQIWYFSWDIITSKGIKKLYPDLTNLIKNKFEKTLRDPEFEEHRVESLGDYIEKLKQPGSLGRFSIETIKKAIEFYPESSNLVQKVQRSSFVRLLYQDKGLIRMIIINLMFLKQSIFQKEILATKPKSMETLQLITDFLDYIFTLATLEGHLLTYGEFKDLWDALYCNKYPDRERNLCIKFVIKFGFLKKESLLNIEDLELFFDKHICSEGILSCNTETVEQDFKFFKICFMSINKKLENIIYNHPEKKADTKKDKILSNLHVLPSKLKGIRNLWKFALEPDNDAQAEEAVQMIKEIYWHLELTPDQFKEYSKCIRQEYISICFEFLEDITQNSLRTESTSQCLRCLNLIKFAIDKSEKSGFVGIKRHFEPLSRGYIILNIEIAGKRFYCEHKRAKIQVDINETILDLRVKIGKQFRILWDSFSMFRRVESLKNLYNNHTLSEVGLTSGEYIFVVQRKTLSRKMKEMVRSWFEEHSDNQKMAVEHLTLFLVHICLYSFDYAMQTVRSLFETFDTDRDSSLNLEEFVSYIQKIYVDNKDSIWKRLYECSYTKDLKKITNDLPEQLDVVELPRYKLATNNIYFQVLYSLLGLDSSIASQAWQLISKLPTNPQLVEDMISLKEVKDDPKNWNLLLDPDSQYKLLYNLVIVDQLITINEKDLADGNRKGSSSILLLLSENPNLFKYVKNWQKSDFVSCGGFSHFIKILNKFQKNSSDSTTTIQKYIISLILKIFTTYLSTSFEINMMNDENSFLHSLMDFVKKNKRIPARKSFAESQNEPILKNLIKDLQILSRI